VPAQPQDESTPQPVEDPTSIEDPGTAADDPDEYADEGTYEYDDDSDPETHRPGQAADRKPIVKPAPYTNRKHEQNPHHKPRSTTGRYMNRGPGHDHKRKPNHARTIQRTVKLGGGCAINRVRISGTGVTVLHVQRSGNKRCVLTLRVSPRAHGSRLLLVKHGRRMVVRPGVIRLG
jgi:hypothetical protein